MTKKWLFYFNIQTLPLQKHDRTRFFWEARAISPQRERSDVHAMLSTLVAIAAFAPPAARTSPHAARSVVQPLRAAQPLCKVWDPDDKVIYVGVPSR